MKFKSILLLILVINFLIIGSGCANKNSDTSPGSENPNNPQASVISKKVFTLESSEIKKALIKSADKIVTKELTDRKDIERLVKFFNSAQQYTGPMTAELQRVIDLIKSDGTVIELKIGGGGHYFSDGTANFKINESDTPFMNWIKEMEKIS